MIEPRVATRVRIDALRRIVEEKGGFATVLARGDAVAGALLVVASGAAPSLWERVPDEHGHNRWTKIRGDAADPAEITAYCERRRGYDPDLWILELDVAGEQQLIAALESLS